MKKQTSSFLVFILLVSILYTSASASSTAVSGVLKRDIKLNKSIEANQVIAGESPTTGLPNSNVVYLPILTQIDNNLGAIPQWGIAQADIIYELPIAGQGLTRLTALFSDHYPYEAGPVRSIRVMHVDLREEWDAALVHWGKQTVNGSNADAQLSKYKVKSKGLAIDGIGTKYEDYLKRVRYHIGPHNVSAYINDLKDMLLSLNYDFPVRPFRFTDNKDYKGTSATQFSVEHKKNKDTSSTFIYDNTMNGYQRYIISGLYSDLLEPETALVYSNVIIQRTKLTFNGSSVNPLLSEVVGSGAADIFISGHYIAGAWSRESLNERTVFYDQSGNEISLQRGKSWIIICDDETEVVIYNADAYSTDQENMDNFSTINKYSVQEESNNDAEEPYYATIKVPGKGPLNMRKEASKQGELLTRIPHGKKVRIIDQEEEWSRIEYDDKVGYVMTSYLVFSDDAQ